MTNLREALLTIRAKPDPGIGYQSINALIGFEIQARVAIRRRTAKPIRILLNIASCVLETTFRGKRNRKSASE